MSNRTHLRDALASYDGKSADFLKSVAFDHGETPGYAAALVDLFEETDGFISDGATWLFRAHVERAGGIDEITVARFANATAQTTTWAAQLHICQTIRSLPFSNTDAGRLAAWLSPLLSHKRPFLRAWSLDALVALSNHNGALADQARTALDRSAGDAAASVRARGRNLLKGLSGQ